MINHFSWTRFLKPDFSNQISQTTFLKQLFYTFLENWLEIKWSSAKIVLIVRPKIPKFCQLNLSAQAQKWDISGWKVFIGHLYSGPTNIQAHYYLWSCITIYVIQKEMLKP